MNKVYKILCIGLSVIMMLSASGCQLAKTEEEQKSKINNDKFVGVFITYRATYSGDEEYMEHENLNETMPDKVYAELTEVEYDGIKSHEYIFKDYEGIPYFVAEISREVSGMDSDYMTTIMNDSIFDASREWKTSDNEEYVNIKGSIYFSKEVTIFENMVFQEEDGDVYFVPADMGVLISSGVERTGKSVENYKNGGGASVELMYTMGAASEKIEIVYLSGDNNVISVQSHKEGEIPTKLNIPKDVEYVMVKNISVDENTQMDIYTREDKFFETKVKGNSYAYIHSTTELVWEE